MFRTNKPDPTVWDDELKQACLTALPPLEICEFDFDEDSTQSTSHPNNSTNIDNNSTVAQEDAAPANDQSSKKRKRARSQIGVREMQLIQKNEILFNSRGNRPATPSNLAKKVKTEPHDTANMDHKVREVFTLFGNAFLKKFEQQIRNSEETSPLHEFKKMLAK